MSNIRKILEEALDKCIKTFKKQKNKYENILVTLQQTGQLQQFFNKLYDMRSELKINQNDILEIIKQLDDKNEIINQNKIIYYLLWFQFFIIVQGQFEQRVDKKYIIDFPQQRKKQLDILQKICFSCKDSKQLNLQQKILKQLEGQDIFIKYIKLIQQNKQKIKQISKIKSQIKKSSLKPLKQRQKQTIILDFIELFTKKIGHSKNIINYKQKRQQLKDYINDILSQTQNINYQILTIQLKQVFKNILCIQIRKNDCKIYDQDQQTIKNSFQMFKLFYQIQNGVIQVKNNQINFQTLFQLIDKLLYSKNIFIWYLPILDNTSLINFLFRNSLDNKNRINKMIQILNKYSPNIDVYIYNTSGRRFLQQMIDFMPFHELINRCMKKLIREQNFDIRENCINGQTYKSRLKGIGIKAQELQNLSIFQQDQFQIYIYSQKHKRRETLNITNQHYLQIVNKTKNQNIYKNLEFIQKNYQLYIDINSKQSRGSFSSGKQGGFTTEVQYNGILNISNMIDYQQLLKLAKWKVVNKNSWTFYEFNQNESQQISTHLYNSRKKTQKFINITLSSLDNKKLQINCRNFEVFHFQSDQKNMAQSKFQSSFGYLIYIPSHKKQSKFFEVFQQYPSIQFDPSPNNQVINKPQKIYTIDEVFPFLGVFKDFFEIQQDYMIDQKQNILTSKRQNIIYLKNWQQITMFKKIQDYLQKKGVVGKRKNSNIFKINIKFYGDISQQIDFISSKINPQKKIQKILYQKNSTIQIVNLRDKEGSYQFFQAILKYLELKINNQKSKSKILLNFNNSDLKMMLKVKSFQSQVLGNKAIFNGSRQDRQQVIKALQQLDQIQQFTYEHSNVYQYMKKMKLYQQKRKQIIVEQVQVGQQMFKLRMRLRDHPKFLSYLKESYQKFQQQPGQTKQEKILNEGQFVQIYRNQLRKIDPQIMITKMGSDILIEYNGKYKNRIKQAMVAIDDEKKKILYECIKKTSNEHYLKNISQYLLQIIRQKFERQLQIISKLNLKPKIQLKFIRQNEYIIKATQISKQQQIKFEQLMGIFIQRYKQYNKIKIDMIDTNKFINRQINKFPKDRLTSIVKQILKKMKIKLIDQINIIINNITKTKLLIIQKQFFDFIKNNNFQNKFQTQQYQNSIKQINKSIKQLNIFGEIFFNQFINNLCQQLQKQCSNEIKDKIFKNMNNVTQQITQAYNKNILKVQIIQKYFKSLNIFGKIYLGQQLPITNHLQKFKEKLQKNDVIMLKVGTGSGKSTVIPPYITALGYLKVVVTQPRRLPCRQIYKRINKVFGNGISGYEVGDGKKDQKNRLLYVTDGLLKVRSLYDFKAFDQIDVLMIDQIHQRSANIDILLLLLHIYYKISKRKLKLILCSATIDTRIGDLMKQSGLKVDTFSVETNRHKVTQHPINQGTLVDKIVQLSLLLNNDEQLLVFVPGIKEVNEIVTILKQKYKKKACPIIGNQNPILQQQYLQIGNIFIATSIAETSLTFKKLKYVVDSRLSRSRKFNSELQLMETEEEFSSNSSIQQRMGRLGRTCTGQYYYFVYHSNDFQNNRQHNPTQLEKLDLTGFIFELLIREGSSFAQVAQLLSKLKHNQSQFSKKIQYSKQNLKDLCVLQNNGSLKSSAKKLLNYGNLANPQHNYALYEGSLANCQLDLIYIISFFTMAENLSGEILKYIKGLFQGYGDIRTIHSFISKIVGDIQLRSLNETQIEYQIKRKCPYVADKSWFKTICRVIKKVKELFRNCNNFVENKNWSQISMILLNAYKNKIFFNQSLFGGNKNLYQKIQGNKIFNFQQKDAKSKLNYKMDIYSALYKKDLLPSIILALNCSVSPENECILSVCEEIDSSKVYQIMKIQIKGVECQQKYFVDTKPIKQKQLFSKIQLQVQSKYKGIKVQNQYPYMKFTGNFNQISNAFNKIIQPQRRNNQIKLDLRLFLDEAISRRSVRAKKDQMMPIIDPKLTKGMLEKLGNLELKDMFQTTKFQMLNNFGVEIQWDAKILTACLITKKAKNIHIQMLKQKIFSFCRWFADSQTICKDQYKIKPINLQVGKYLNKQTRDSVVKRINNIVDSKIDRHIIKSWVNGKGPETKYPRTARMIAVCWILVTVFNCTIKGGFVRDWVINKEQVLPAGDLSKLLKLNNRNGFLQVIDETVTPSDIDAQLSKFELFDEGRFIKQMSKLNISVKIQEDGWRRHVIFDQGLSSGGFTADLIQPYTTYCHDTYDFDVNTFYLKKDNLNSLGLKIPLQFENNKKKALQIEQVVASCRKKQMLKLKENMPAYRYDKFKKKGWKIVQNENFIPVIYKNYITQSSTVPPQQIQKVSPQFYRQMVQKRKAKVVKIESLRNKAWDDAFQAIQHWIITEIENANQASDPINFRKIHVNSNNKMLFHGSKTAGIEGIKLSGFDSRFFNATGFYGRGAYFADDPQLSNRFTDKDNNKLRKMFVVKVALGKQQILNNAANNKLGPSKGYHSLLGQAGGHKQYIIQRWGQAKPMHLIYYEYD